VITILLLTISASVGLFFEFTKHSATSPVDTTRDPIIGVLAVGPMSGVKLHEKIILNTKAAKDQHHFEVVHLSRPNIPDRTDFLLKTEGKQSDHDKLNPGEFLYKSVETLSRYAMDRGTYAICAVPSNTFHARTIVGILEYRIKELNRSLGCEKNNWTPGCVRLISLVECVSGHLASKEKYGTVGIIDSNGCVHAEVYRSVLELQGHKVVQLDGPHQNELRDCVHNPVYGLKALNKVSPRVLSKLKNHVKILKNLGADCILIGIISGTGLALSMKELHGIPLIDPLEILARSVVHLADRHRLKTQDEADQAHYIDLEYRRKLSALTAAEEQLDYFYYN